ncbi:cytochrome P450 2U1-like isoform X2 [Babylonia areolata]|uniref:cytochrome P450 2U1-like isoform X2 n=1 Tax=Babylonia areolata TaxID=304850 RepID=UPI003FD26423
MHASSTTTTTTITNNNNMDPLTASIACVALTLTFLWWWVSTSRPPGFPPGPGGALPIIGHAHLLGRDPRAQFRAWRQAHGDVFGLYMGGRPMVVLSGQHVLREALVRQADVFSHRPDPSVFDLVTKSKGVGESSGPVWKVQRKITLEALRNLGMGKNLMAEKLHEEISEFLSEIRSKDSQPFDPTRLIQVSVSNNICSISFGKRFHYDDQHFLKLQAALEEMLQIGGRASYIVFVPFLRYLPGDLFHIERGISLYNYITDTFLIPIIEQHVQNHKKGLEEEEEDFISAYLKEARLAQAKGTADYVNEFNLQKVLMDLFAGGTDTTNSALRWAIIYFLHYPEVQEKCHQDIVRVIGPNFRPPRMADRAEMTYIEATIHELLRVAEVVPLGIAHAPAREMTFQGYTIPKDAYIIPNLNSVLHDPEVWPQPEVFRPERFIGEDGKLVKVDHFLPFSLGRRVCLGESLARMELFLYLTSMVQHFRFLPPEDGQLPSLEGDIGLVHVPKPFLVRAVPRQ